MKALVLAGQRPGGDPLASSLGISHKALIPVGGKPMLSRVIETLQNVAVISDITIVTEEPQRMQHLANTGWLEAKDTPSLSAAAGLAALGAPLLITTADHALLQPAHIETFLQDIPPQVDVAAALVARDVIETRFPLVKRTYIPFRGGGYSGANLFLLQTDDAMKAVEFWRRIEMNRKKPWHIAKAFGPWLLLNFLLRRFDMKDALSRAGQAMGVRAAGVSLPFAEAAVDVDKASDLELAELIVAGKA